MICIEIKSKNASPFFATTWYRLPKLSVESLDKFEGFLRQIDSEYNEFYILGDLIVNLLDNTPGTNSSRLNDIMNDYQLTQLINEPTRETSHSKSLIDLLITNDRDKIALCGVYPSSISDHHLIYAIRKVGIPRGNPKIIVTRNLKNFDEDKFKFDLEQVQWPVIDNFLDVHEAWACWRDSFIGNLDNHAPMRKFRIRNKCSPWINKDLKKGKCDLVII